MPLDRTAFAGPRRSGSLRRWLRAFLAALAYAVVGMLLSALPWLPDWDQNYFSGNSPEWYSLWMNAYFRGAVSGVGVVNLCVCVLEVYGLLRGGKR